MADRLRIFISSRVADTIPARKGARRPLKQVREEMKRVLETALDGKSVEVLVNETEPAETDLDAIERCRRWVRDAHLVVAIVNGHAGTKTPEGIGICHLELKTAMEDCREKVLVIRVAGHETKRNFERYPEFRTYFETIWSGWTKFGAEVATAEDIVDRGVRAVGQAVARMAAISLREWRRGAGVEGEKFEWASKPYSERSDLLVRNVLGALGEHEGSAVRTSTIRPPGTRPPLLELAIDNVRLVATLTGVPDSFGVADARKYCGYPFREDEAHLADSGRPNARGPLHLVAVYKRVTEGQIRAHVGNPDISIIRTKFGYVCQDRSQAIQVAYLLDIDDSTRARQRAHEVLEWLGEERFGRGVNELAEKRRLMSQRPPSGPPPRSKRVSQQ